MFGFINIPNDFLYDIIQHSYFQRLNRIKQLGLSSFVYPGAQHTRMQHSLGAMHLMGEAITQLRQEGNDITQQEAEAVRACILLHDIGHGPFSHTLEHSLVSGVSHEEISLLMMRKINREMDGKLDMALEIFINNYPKKFLHQLVASQLDMDRLDYLSRDSFYSGVSEGIIGAARIIKMLNIHNDKLVVEAKGIAQIAAADQFQGHEQLAVGLAGVMAGDDVRMHHPGAGLGLAAWRLQKGADPYRVAGFGAVAGIAAFCAVIFSAPTNSPALFALGVTLVGFGAGLFAHGTLTASMAMAQSDATGLALGAWGAVQALAAGLAIAAGGLIGDVVSAFALHGRLGPVLVSPATGFTAVYLLEVVLLFFTLVAIGPLASFQDIPKSPIHLRSLTDKEAERQAVQGQEIRHA